jgi:hypothetical protein
MGSRGIALPIRDPRHQEGMGWLAPRPGRFTPGKETRYPLYRRLLPLLVAPYLCSSNYNRLVSVNYESSFFRKSLKTPFAVFLLCL